MISIKRSRAAVIPVLVLVILLAACGSGGGGDTSGPSSEDLAATEASLSATQAALDAAQQSAEEEAQEPTATTEAESSESQGDTAEEPTAEEAPAFYREEWDGDVSLWTYFTVQGEEGEFDIYREDGKMIFDISETDVYTYLTYDAYFYTDARIDVETKNRGSNNNNISLICRETERGFYEFSVASSGLYWIWLWEDDGGYTMLYNGGSESIRTGKDTNQFTAICEGEELSLYINGTHERTITNTVLDEGRVGIGVSSLEFAPVEVEFEWVEISQP